MFTVTRDGGIGIGTANPSDSLTVAGSFSADSPTFVVDAVNDSVGIGTANPKYKLDVIGDIRATGSVYYGGTTGNADGAAYTKPDFVFESGYRVRTIAEVESFLKNEGHLPWLTSAKQDQQENNGAINMTRMNFETVETAENLKLQIITLNNELKEKDKQIAELNEKVERILAKMETK